MTILRGQKSIGLSTRATTPPTLPLPADDLNVILPQLLERLQHVETLVERKADSGQVRSLIAISPEAILISAQDIVLNGTVTIGDIINEQNGTTTGQLPSQITRIIGDRIQTGTITSNNYGSSAGTAINLNDGTIVVGGTASPSLLFSGGNLTISGRLTADSLVLTKNLTLGQISDTAAGALPSSSFGSALQGSLNAGVNNIIAGMSGDFRLDVGTSSIIAKHKNANESGLGAGYAGAIRTGLILTANGIGMGYNRTSDGAWINAISIGSTGDVAILGTLTAGSVVTGSVTVDGVALSTVRANAATGNTHAGSTGNPHSTSLAQVGGDLDDIANGSTYFRTTANEVTGANRGFNALDSGFDYIRAISTQKIVVSGSNPTNGLVIDSAGLRAYKAGALTFNIVASTGAATFSGDVVTSGQVKATGATSSSEGDACIIGESSTSGRRGGIFIATNTAGAVGLSSTGPGLYGKTGSSSEPGVLCSNTGSGPALAFESGHIAKGRVTGQVIDIWEYPGGTFVGTYEFAFRKA